jgi:hypothetical protein
MLGELEVQSSRFKVRAAHILSFVEESATKQEGPSLRSGQALNFEPGTLNSFFSLTCLFSFLRQAHSDFHDHILLPTHRLPFADLNQNVARIDAELLCRLVGVE